MKKLFIASALSVAAFTFASTMKEREQNELKKKSELSSSNGDLILHSQTGSNRCGNTFTYQFYSEEKGSAQYEKDSYVAFQAAYKLSSGKCTSQDVLNYYYGDPFTWEPKHDETIYGAN